METKIFCCATNFLFIKETSASSRDQCLFRRPLPPQKPSASSGDHCLFRRPSPTQENIASSRDQCLLERPLPPQKTSASSGNQCLLLSRPWSIKVSPMQTFLLWRSVSSQDTNIFLADRFLPRRQTSQEIEESLIQSLWSLKETLVYLLCIAVSNVSIAGLDNLALSVHCPVYTNCL